MGFVEMIFVCLGALVLLALLYLLSIYNRLSFYIDKMESKYSTIYDYMLDITKLIEDNKQHIDKDKISKINALIQEVRNKDDKDIQLQSTIELVGLLSTGIINDKVVNEETTSILKDTLTEINYSKEFYNKCVSDYNQYCKKKMVNLIARIFKFKNYPYINRSNDEV